MTETVDIVIRGAHELITCRGPADGVRGADLKNLECIPGGAVAVDNGRIVAVGSSAEVEARYQGRETIDATGRLVSPGLVDPHSHLLYAGSRHDEWEFKVTGDPLETALAGGIHRSVAWTRDADDASLVAQALNDLDVMAIHGTTTLEAKTGYGLTRESELRHLKLTVGLEHAIDIVPTFLGAHVPPPEYPSDHGEYVDLIVDMIPEMAEYAEYCDVCCDPIGFTADECLRMGAAARKAGMGVRVHADQTGDADGARVAAELGAISADHLDYTSDAGFRAMAEAGTVAILFPGVTLHMLEMTPKVAGGELGEADKPFMPLLARRAVEAGGVVALSTDYNPGSCPTPSMQTVMQLAARLYRLNYAEIWHMSTLNAACSLDRGADRGSLEVGKRADILMWSVPEHGMAINRFGVNLVDTVVIAGRVAVRDQRDIKDELRGGTRG